MAGRLQPTPYSVRHRPRYKEGFVAPLAQSIGKRQTPHDVAAADLGRGVGAEGNLQLTSVPDHRTHP